MIECEHDQAVLGRLVGCWQGTLLHRARADQPFQQTAGTSDNRWVLCGRFVEMTLRVDTPGDAWSALFYIGYERCERRHVSVSLEPGDRRVTTRLGDWRRDQDQLVLTSHQARAVCDVTIPGRLKLELAEEPVTGAPFVRFRADYRSAVPAVIVKPALPRAYRRFVIA